MEDLDKCTSYRETFLDVTHPFGLMMIQNRTTTRVVLLFCIIIKPQGGDSKYDPRKGGDPTVRCSYSHSHCSSPAPGGAVGSHKGKKKK
jgi:hypothetical protein